MKTVHRTSLTVKQDSDSADQEEAARELSALQDEQSQLGQQVSAVGVKSIDSPADSLTATRADELRQQLETAELTADLPPIMVSTTRQFVQHPSLVGQAIGRIPVLGKLADSLGIIQTTDRRVVETAVREERPPEMSEAAREQLNQAKQ